MLVLGYSVLLVYKAEIMFLRGNYKSTKIYDLDVLWCMHTCTGIIVIVHEDFGASEYMLSQSIGFGIIFFLWTKWTQSFFWLFGMGFMYWHFDRCWELLPMHKYYLFN